MVRCRRGCGQDVVYEDQHIIATPDGDAWLCDPPPMIKVLGSDPHDLEAKVKALKAMTPRPGFPVLEDADPHRHIINRLGAILDLESDVKALTLNDIENALHTLMAESTPMYLSCPGCKARHIDVGEFATRPHHTHSCQECGLTWRPAIGPTVGVKFLPGFKNEPERNPLDPGDGPMEIHSIPFDGGYSVVRVVHHKGCSGGAGCPCKPITTTDRHYRGG